MSPLRSANGGEWRRHERPVQRVVSWALDLRSLFGGGLWVVNGPRLAGNRRRLALNGCRLRDSRDASTLRPLSPLSLREGYLTWRRESIVRRLTLLLIIRHHGSSVDPCVEDRCITWQRSGETVHWPHAPVQHRRFIHVCPIHLAPRPRHRTGQRGSWRLHVVPGAKLCKLPSSLL